ncbi:hypothetical protein NJL88_08995 [Streptomyces sp. DK15]|uniref:hypothetical protein n=1 Tax=Streptomyces sp. DK15 TaxID=2957499 RepID=UPI0029BEEEF7|nr:hypothetical protein [Streptomyces sp. DK15]MDX2390200.1 hypothetical protein [Streptomyces sp. DK15]
MRNYMNKALGLVNEFGKFVDIFSALNVRRPAQEGAADVGDVHAVPFILECKNVKSPAVPTFLRQAEVEARHAGFPYGVAVVKVPRMNVRRGKVHFTVRTWTRVRRALGLTTQQMRDAYGFAVSLRGLDSGKWYLTTDVEAFTRLVADMRKGRSY